MSFIVILLITFLCASSFNEAVVWDGAKPTSPVSSPGWNPKPTPPPILEVQLRSNDLLIRGAAANVCGAYVNGSTSTNNHVLPAKLELGLIDNIFISYTHYLPNIHLWSHRIRSSPGLL